MRNWILTLLMGTGGTLLLPSTLTAGYGCQSYRCMSCDRLWYERNAIFARKGYCFRTRRAVRVFGYRCYPEKEKEEFCLS